MDTVLTPLDSRLNYDVARENYSIFRSTSMSHLQSWINRCFLTANPFAFKEGQFSKFRQIASDCFDVEHHNVWCSGSGALGFSLNHRKTVGDTIKYFDTDSDLDIAIISTHYFDQAWKDLREKYRDKSRDPSRRFMEKLEAQRYRLFDGAIQTNKLLAHLSMGDDWMRAQRKLATETSLMFDREVDVQFWIYRDMWSLRNYVFEGAHKVRSTM